MRNMVYIQNSRQKFPFLHQMLPLDWPWWKLPNGGGKKLAKSFNYGHIYSEWKQVWNSSLINRNWRKTSATKLPPKKKKPLKKCPLFKTILSTQALLYNIGGCSKCGCLGALRLFLRSQTLNWSEARARTATSVQILKEQRSYEAV